MGRRERFAMTATLALGLLGAAPGHVLAGPGLACGDTITSNTTLGADLDCSAYAGTAVTFGADNIVLDLGGHSILGLTGDDSYHGVDSGSYNNVVVRNGTIANFDIAINFDNSSDSNAKRLTLNGETGDASYGIYSTSGSFNTISKVRINQYPTGIYMHGGAGHQVTWSTVTGSSGDGIYTQYESNDLIANNTFNGISGTSYGIYSDFSSHMKYLANTASNGYTGFYFDCDSYGSSVVENNVADHNTNNGFYLYYCYDSTTYKGSTVKGNNANHNAGDGFYDNYSINSTWIGNTSRRNAGNGIFIDFPGSYIIKDNSTNYNGGNGISLEDNYASGYYGVENMSRNKASHNHDYGFTAVYGVPGRHNLAAHNGSGNCHNVSCK